MNARELTAAITSSPGVVAVFDGISERAAQALCEAIEQEVAPFAAGLEAMRERAESAEARIAEVSGVTREQLARREYERGLAVGGARVAELTAALKATLCLSDACRCYGCGVARKVLASEVTP